MILMFVVIVLNSVSVELFCKMMCLCVIGLLYRFFYIYGILLCGYSIRLCFVKVVFFFGLLCVVM